jgi:Helix-turn-helix domain of transposase family ISL3
VPWARPGSGFTLRFEALVMTMVTAMPVTAVARIVGEHNTRLWRVIHHYVDEARSRTDASGVTRLAIDETAARRAASLYLSTSTKPASCSLQRATMPPPLPPSPMISLRMATIPTDQPGLRRYEPGLHQGQR